MNSRRSVVALTLAGFTVSALFAADVSIQLRTQDGSSDFVIQNAAGATVGRVDSLGRANFETVSGDASGLTNLPTTELLGIVANSSLDDSSVTLQGNLFNGPNRLVQLNTGAQLPALDASLLTGIIASSIAINAVQDSAIVGLTASKLTGIISNARLDSSSVTLAGNIFNTASHLVQTDSSNRLPALNASQLTNIIASSIGVNSVQDSAIVGMTASKLSGALPALDASQLTGIVASSIGVNAVQDSAIVGLTASKLTGTINTARLDSSSVTLAGNLFNSASHLVQTDSSNRLPALDASQLTGIIASSIAVNSIQDSAIVGMTASKLSGTINNARLDSSSVTLVGNTFNVANGLTKLDSSGNLLLPNGGGIYVGSLKGTLVPSGTIILTTSTCPSGFSEFIGARGFYLSGVPSGGTVGGSVGNAMTDLANPNHAHSITSNTTALTLGIPVTNMLSSINATTGNVDRGTVAPFFQIRLCVVP